MPSNICIVRTLFGLYEINSRAWCIGAPHQMICAKRSCLVCLEGRRNFLIGGCLILCIQSFSCGYFFYCRCCCCRCCYCCCSILISSLWTSVFIPARFFILLFQFILFLYFYYCFHALYMQRVLKRANTIDCPVLTLCITFSSDICRWARAMHRKSERLVFVCG